MLCIEVDSGLTLHLPRSLKIPCHYLPVPVPSAGGNNPTWLREMVGDIRHGEQLSRTSRSWWMIKGEEWCSLAKDIIPSRKMWHRGNPNLVSLAITRLGLWSVLAYRMISSKINTERCRTLASIYT